MSFIYARKFENALFIFSDTKITFANDDTRYFSKKAFDLVKRYGAIKSYIISREFCIAYAGQLMYASKLLQQIDHLSIDDLKELALSIHIESCMKTTEENDYSTDFIIGYIDKDTHLYQIKNRTCSEVQNSYLGSYEAFNYFQKININRENTTIASNNPLGVHGYDGTHLNGHNECQNKEYERLFKAFYKTVHDSGDKSVGGYVVPVVADLNKHSFYRPGYSIDFSILTPKTTVLNTMYLDCSSENGAYTEAFYETNNDIIAIYFHQGGKGVVFSSARIDENDYENLHSIKLSLPIFYTIPNVVFFLKVKSYGLKHPPMFLCDFNLEDINYFYKCYDVNLEKNPDFALLCLNYCVEIIEKQKREASDYYYIYNARTNLEKKLRDNRLL